MSVPNQTPYIIYNANGMTTVFPFEFYIINANDIQISLNGEVISSGYSVSGVGNIAGGDVIFLTPPANGTVVMLERVVPTYRLTDYQDNGDLLADTVNKDFDRLWMAIQRYGIHLGLALKRPLFGGPFDAEGYRISNLADPVNDQDAATKKYVESVSLARTLRVPENTVQAVPSVSMRANKLLAFNAAGDPIAVLPASGSASDVLIELAKPTGAGLSGTTSGGTVQTDLDKLNKQNDAFAYIEDYAALVVSGDWTAAIQAAFDTGKTVIGKQGKTYKTTAIINSNGQPFIGRLSLQLARASIPSATFDVEYSKPSEQRYFRAIYVQSAYDLCELLRIKSMGFNTILHYCYFDNNGSIDIGGNITQLIKNAATAGLNVVINTQNSVAHNNGTVAQVVAAADPYQNVIGYSVIDEPGSAGHSLAEQEAAISTLRALTTKKLFSVDFIWRLNTWSKPWSYNYDVFLVDSYSMYYASGTLADRVNKDLGKMRTDFGAAMKMTGNAKVIPCIQTFAEPVQNPVEGISGTYCFDVDQACAASKVFGRAGNGDFACFVWDASFPSNLANNVKFQSMIAELMQHAGSGEVYKTEPIIFGGVGSVYQRSLHDILAVAARKDPENSTDGWLGGGAWPVRLITGASETPIRTTTAGINLAGIGFRNVFSRLVTTKSLLKYFTGFAVFENYGPALTGPASFNVYSTNDGGYTETIRYNTGVTAGTPFRFSSLMTNSYDGIGEDAVFDITVTGGDAHANYRRFVYGLFVSTNW
ncbi:phage tail fiber protein [Enterobacter roggenkampii]|uniref:phage tail fiber domain-containing protein n=1 Tax=Enterobacter roggenkampii TaxID=1812935 RepID=UPI001E5040AE|nr:phage tail fiber protein [Enterobacter roggenkampii]MCE1461568.1 hypothetical protein [Enterobacter roggenkampii]